MIEFSSHWETIKNTKRPSPQWYYEAEEPTPTVFVGTVLFRAVRFFWRIYQTVFSDEIYSYVVLNLNLSLIKMLLMSTLNLI